MTTPYTTDYVNGHDRRDLPAWIPLTLSLSLAALFLTLCLLCRGCGA